MHEPSGRPRVSGVTGDHEAERDRAVELARLRVERREWYDEPAMDVRVPHPARDLEEDPGSSLVRAAAAACYLLAGIYGHQLSGVAEDTGHQGLSGIAFLIGLGFSIAFPVSLVRVWTRRRTIPLHAEIARPWLDLLDALRLAGVQPANPAWPTAQAHVAQAQRLMRREARRMDKRVCVPDDVVAEVQDAGATTWAVGELWRRRMMREGTGSPLERLPVVVGPTPEEASVASDAAADAATAALGHGDFDLDFSDLARRRAAMYGRRTGPDQRCRDPRRPLRVGSVWGRRATRQALASLGATVLGGAASVALLGAGQAWWSALAAAAASIGAYLGLRLLRGWVVPGWTKLAPGPAMAWRDYVDSVAYADSGAAPVMTVEAIRGSEQRVRAVAIELMSPTLSATDRPVLTAELYRWCSGAWTLVGQERAEDRLLDELDDTPRG